MDSIKIILVATALLVASSCRQFYNSRKNIEPQTIPSIYNNSQNGDFNEKNGVMYCNDVLFSGFVVTLFSNGDTNSVIGYLNGLKENTSRIWWDNKQWREVRVYHLNKKIGEHTGWFENGTMRFKYQFGSDVYDGTVEEWFADGKRATLFNYESGYEMGLQQAWYADGKYKFNYEVVNGRKYGLTGVKNCESVLDTSLNSLIAKKYAQ